MQGIMNVLVSPRRSICNFSRNLLSWEVAVEEENDSHVAVNDFYGDDFLTGSNDKNKFQSYFGQMAIMYEVQELTIITHRDVCQATVILQTLFQER